jgi:pilus assembly protein Flp/PilA
MFALAAKLYLDRAGTNAIEYALIAALIAVAIIGAMTAVGSSLSGANGPIVAAANALASGS